MDCTEARQLIEQGVMPSASRGRPDLGFHLASCATCRIYRAALSRAQATARSATPAALHAPVQIKAKATRRVWPVAVLLVVIAFLGVGIWYLGLPTYRAWRSLRVMTAVDERRATLPTITSANQVVPQPSSPPMLAVTSTTPEPRTTASPATPMVSDQPPAQQPLLVATSSATVVHEQATEAPTAPPVPPDQPPATAEAAELSLQAAAVNAPRTTIQNAAPLNAATADPAIPPNATSVVIEPPPVELPDGLTVLLLGIDARAGEGMHGRSDAILVARLDPQQRLVGLLSLPRDLWVSIPDVGTGKLNGAFFIGESYAPGNGAALARQTVSNALGIPIDYHVVVDFQGFEALIDTLGGITIDVPAELYDAQYPTPDYGYAEVHFLPGPQQMNGARALEYSRIRHADSDFGRMSRQQLVLLAIANTLQARNVLATIHEVDRLTAALEPYVHSDMPTNLVVRMLWSLRDTNLADVQRLAVDVNELQDANIGGVYALVADPTVLLQLGTKLVAPPQP